MKLHFNAKVIKVFKNRTEAGEQLAEFLKEKGIEIDVVMAIPRGGVVVAEVIADAFRLPLDVVMVKKLGSPYFPDYAMGAVTPDGEIIRHQNARENMIETDQNTIDKLAAMVMGDINLRLNTFRSCRPAVSVKGKAVLLVDDGIATGFTMKAAVRYLTKQEARQVVVAVPVCAVNAYHNLKEEVENMISLKIPTNFYAVSQFYQDFSAVEDHEVIEALRRSNPQSFAG